MYPIIFLILTDDSTLLSHKARMFDYSNAHLLWTWLALNIVARYECVYNRNSKNFKDKHKMSNSWEKVGEKFNLSCRFMNIFRILRFWSWLVVALELKEELNLLAAKFPPRCPPCCLLWFSREHNARVHMTFPLNEMYVYSRLCDRLRSSAIIWKPVPLRSSAIYDLRSAIIWKPAFSFWTQNFRSHCNHLGHEINYCRRSYERNMYTIVMWSLKIARVELVSSRCWCNAPTELECETNCGWASYTQFGCQAKNKPPFQNRCTRECSLREHELNIVDVLVLPLKLSHSSMNSRW